MSDLIVNVASTPNELSQLTGEVLRDLARNESASREIRKAAVEQLLEKKSHFANLAELRELVLQINAEHEAKKEVEEVVAAAVAEASTENVQIPGEKLKINADGIPFFNKPAQTLMRFDEEDGA